MLHAQDRPATITIELHNLQAPFAAIGLAEATVTRVYTNIGVIFHFRMGTSNSPSNKIAIEFKTGTPAALHPGALAYCELHETSPIQIHVLFDRVRRASSDPPLGILLGYVIAHELGHILEASNKHSANGIMKAHWTYADFEQMSIGEFRFSSEDVESIRIGIGLHNQSPPATRAPAIAVRR